MIHRIFPIICAVAILVAPGAAHADAADLRTITASGRASITAAPDFAIVRLAVNHRARTIDVARDEVNRKVAEFLRFADEMKIPEEHVDTTGLSIYPVYEQTRTMEQPGIRGYTVERSIRVRLTKLDDLGELLEGSIDLGVNSVSPPALDTTKRDELHREALALATADARLNAEAAIAPLDASLGAIRTLHTSGASAPPGIPRFARAEAMMADASASYQAAEIRISADVTATFDVVVD